MVCTQDGAFPTPREIIEYLDRRVHGQEPAKRALATCVYKHYLAMAYRAREPGTPLPFGKGHALLIGPTGCGKTFLVRNLAEFLGVPVAFVNATTLVEAGYVGDHVDSIFSSLLAAARGSRRRAQQGIIFLDEVDKIRRQESGGRDVSGEGVQTMLLPLLDGGKVTVSHYFGDTEEFDAGQLLVIAAGAFVGLAERVRKRRDSAPRLGFGAVRDDRTAPDNALHHVESADLEAFGLIPEFIGRFATVAVLDDLAARDLVAILAEREDSPLRQQQRLFTQHGIELCLTDEALELVASQAVRDGTNARGAERMLLTALGRLDWRLPELAAQGVQRVTFDAPAVTGQREPLMERSEVANPCAATRLRREAASLLGRTPHPRRAPRQREQQQPAIRSNGRGGQDKRPVDQPGLFDGVDRGGGDRV